MMKKFNPLSKFSARLIPAQNPAMYHVRIPRSISWSWKLIIALIVLTLAAMLLVPWQQTSSSTGRVIAYTPQERDQGVDAPIKGRISKWHVVEGEHVEKGQLLATIMDNDPKYRERLEEQRDAVITQRDAISSSIENVEQQLEALTEARRLSLEAYDAKIKMARFEVESAVKEIEGAQGEETAARQYYERKSQLSEKGLASTQDTELARAKEIKTSASVLKAKAKRQEKRAKVLSLEAGRQGKAAEVDAKLAELRSKLQEKRSKLAKAQGDLSKAEVKLARQAQMDIIAPRSGVLLEINARENSSFVKAGDTLATIVPDTDSRAVEVFINGNDAPLVWPGRKVRLQFEGWPAVQFSGWPSVAIGTFGGTVSFIDARATKKGKFRVVIVPDPEDKVSWPGAKFLRQGVRANGWILLNEVTLGYELWRQVNGFPPAIPEEALATDGPKGDVKLKSKKKK